jgi:hypothetical protein
MQRPRVLVLLRPCDQLDAIRVLPRVIFTDVLRMYSNYDLNSPKIHWCQPLPRDFEYRIGLRELCFKSFYDGNVYFDIDRSSR